MILTILFKLKYYRPVIEHACEGMETFRLVPAHHKITLTKDPLKHTPWEEHHDTSRLTPMEEYLEAFGTHSTPTLRRETLKDRKDRFTHRRSERSAPKENSRQDAQYQEFAGKFIKYNIINLKEI